MDPFSLIYESQFEGGIQFLPDEDTCFVRVCDTYLPTQIVMCPICRMVDMATTFDTGVVPWIACCSEGHRFPVDPRPQA